MAWSISQDDDGLEGLSPHSAGGHSAHGHAAGGHAVSGEIPPSGAYPVRSASSGGASHAGSASVVVDPVSQIPSAAPVRAAKRPSEPTVVLQHRQLDRLRAEVRRRQSEFRIRRLGSFAFWVVAGALAVFGGAVLARNWSSKSEAARPGAESADRASRVTAIDAAARRSAPVAVPVPIAVPAPLPVAGPVPSASTARPDEAPPAEKSPTPAPSGSAFSNSLSLEELPTE